MSGSFISYDRLGPAVAKANFDHAVYRRFHAVWPNDGVLYNKKMVYYQKSTKIRSDEPFKRWCNIMGITWDDLNTASYDSELTSVYFELKPLTQDAPFELTNAIIPINNDNGLTAGNTFDITVVYGGDLPSILPADTITALNTSYDGTGDPVVEFVESMTSAEVVQAIMADPGSHLLGSNTDMPLSARRNNISVNGVKLKVPGVYYNYPNTYFSPPSIAISSTTKYGFYALFDTAGTVFETTYISSPITRYVNDKKEISFTISFKLLKTMEITDTCFTSFISAFDSLLNINRKAWSLPLAITEEDYDSFYQITDDANWSGGQLKVDALKAMKRAEVGKLIAKALTSDYTVEAASKWEKVVAVVIVIIAIIVAVVSYGTSTGWSAEISVAALAWAFGSASITLYVGSAILSYYGGLSAQRLVKTIGGVAQVTGYVSTVLGIYAVIENIVKEAAKKFTAQLTIEAADKASASALDYAYSAVKVAYDMSKSAITSSVNFTGSTSLEAAKKLLSWANTSFKVYQYYDQNYGKMADMESQLKDAESEISRLESLNEENAPHMIDVFGMEVFQDSLGSYDSIAELEKKVELSMGGHLAAADPTSRLT